VALLELGTRPSDTGPKWYQLRCRTQRLFAPLRVVLIAATRQTSQRSSVGSSYCSIRLAWFAELLTIPPRMSPLGLCGALGVLGVIGVVLARARMRLAEGKCHLTARPTATGEKQRRLSQSSLRPRAPRTLGP